MKVSKPEFSKVSQKVRKRCFFLLLKLSLLFYCSQMALIHQMKIRGSNTEVIFKWLRSFLFQSLFIIIYQKKEKLYTIMIKTMIVDLAFLAAICRSISSLSVTILFYDVNFNCFWCSLCKKILHHKKIIIWTWIVAEIQDMGQFWKFSQDNIIPDMQKKIETFEDKSKLFIATS